MTDIKFRAKRLDNGEWVYGYYALLPHPLSGFLKSFMVVSSYNEKEECGLQDFVLIDKNTLGQYTGEKDKNGKEIYEGDIVIYDFTRYVTKEPVAGIVEYKTEYASYGIVPLAYRDSIVLFGDLDMNAPLEVVGNIHDKENRYFN